MKYYFYVECAWGVDLICNKKVCLSGSRTIGCANKVVSISGLISENKRSNLKKIFTWTYNFYTNI